MLSRPQFSIEEWTALKAAAKEEQFALFVVVRDFPPVQLSAKDCDALRAADERNFVLTIRDDIVRDSPDLANDQGLFDRLNAAYDEAKRLGLKDDHRIVQFLYMDSIDPAFYKKPAVARWLNGNRRPIEERLDLMLDVARATLRNKQREKQ